MVIERRCSAGKCQLSTLWRRMLTQRTTHNYGDGEQSDIWQKIFQFIHVHRLRLALMCFNFLVSNVKIWLQIIILDLLMVEHNMGAYESINIVDRNAYDVNYRLREKSRATPA